MKDMCRKDYHMDKDANFGQLVKHFINNTKEAGFEDGWKVMENLLLTQVKYTLETSKMGILKVKASVSGLIVTYLRASITKVIKQVKACLYAKKEVGVIQETGYLGK